MRYPVSMGGSEGAYGTLRMLPKVVDQTVEQVSLPTRSDLSDDQCEVFSALERWAFSSPSKTKGLDGLLTLGGYAGCGKTTLVSLLGAELARSGQRVAYVTYTGKAATVLARKFNATGINAGYVGTIHRLMYEPILEEITQRVIGWQKVESLPFDKIVIDEASMVSEDLFNDLASYGVPILAVGDHGQLPPIGGSFNLVEKPHLRLEKIHRQAAGSPILALSAYVREHGGLPRKFDGKQSVFLWRPEDQSELIASSYTAADAVREIGTICYLNRTRCTLNQRIRAHFQLPVDQVGPVPGEWIICLKNTKFGQVVVSNGQRAKVLASQPLDAHRLSASLAFLDEGYEISATLCRYQFGQPNTFADLELIREMYEIQAFDWPDLGMLCDYGYALTCHKSQGDQWERAIVVVEFPQKVEPDTRRRWIYTAVTRAVKELHLVVPRNSNGWAS